MKDYSVLEGLDRNFNIELRCAYDRGYRHGRDDEWAETKVKESETKDEGYNRGLEDAWACAKRIIKLSPDMQEDIFNMRGDHFILDAYSAEEAIDILKRYDEKNDDIKVGDKVRTLKDSDGVHNLFPIWTIGIVEEVDESHDLQYKVSADGDYWWYRRDMIELVKDDEIEVGDEIVYSDPLKGEEKGIAMGICNNWVEVKFLKSWNCIGVHKDSVKKTGRHFEQLDEILETMKK